MGRLGTTRPRATKTASPPLIMGANFIFPMSKEVSSESAITSHLFRNGDLRFILGGLNKGFYLIHWAFLLQLPFPTAIVLVLYILTLILWIRKFELKSFFVFPAVLLYHPKIQNYNKFIQSMNIIIYYSNPRKYIDEIENVTCVPNIAYGSFYHERIA